MYVQTEPTQAKYIGDVRLVGETLGRGVTWQDLDKMAEQGVFVDPWHHLYYDLHLTFKERN